MRSRITRRRSLAVPRPFPSTAERTRAARKRRACDTGRDSCALRLQLLGRSSLRGFLRRAHRGPVCEESGLELWLGARYTRAHHALRVALARTLSGTPAERVPDCRYLCVPREPHGQVAYNRATTACI